MTSQGEAVLFYILGPLAVVGIAFVVAAGIGAERTGAREVAAPFAPVST